jgi:putative membrane protein
MSKKSSNRKETISLKTDTFCNIEWHNVYVLNRATPAKTRAVFFTGTNSTRALLYETANIYLPNSLTMKKYLIPCLLLCVCFGCNNNPKSSVQKADSTNRAKNDTSGNYSDTGAKNNTSGVIGVDEATAKFLVNVADIDLTEIQLGHLAKEKATNQRVKDFGSIMVQDHTKADNELKALAAGKHVTLPTRPSAEHEKKIDVLVKASSKDFDKYYIDMMVDGHESAIKDFNNNKDNKDADVKKFVNTMLPTLQMHLDSAKAIKKSIK